MAEKQPYPVGSTERGQLVDLYGAANGIPVIGTGRALNTADLIWKASFDGKLFTASDADQNDLITTQTSFVATTPSIMIDVPEGINCVPLCVNLSQTGSVAGDVVHVIIEIDRVDRFNTGGTAETIFNTYGKKAKCVCYTGATANSGYGVRVWAAAMGFDVSPAEGAVQGPFWKPDYPMILRGPAALLVYTFAGTTAPSWYWNTTWMEFTDDELLYHLGVAVTSD